MISRLVAAVAAVLALLALPLGAQGLPEVDPDEPVSLVADEIQYDSEARTVTAIGDVEVYYGPRTLTAERITYSDVTRRIEAMGNIVLRDEDGTTIFADFADLDVDLRDGLIQGARALLDQQTKLAAVEGRRVDDRYNILNKVTYSPCDVCAEEPTPLWRIRARRVIHDQEEKVVHYENARLEVFGVPVLWTPYFSHPDPTVDRATGFLTPSVSTSTELGFGAQVPFYWAIDPSTDLLLSPALYTDQNPVGFLTFRRAFDFGSLRLSGSVTRSDFASEGETRTEGHIDTEGDFRLSGINFGWDIEGVSDDDYLRFYDISNESRLESEIFADFYRRDAFVDVSAVRFQSLRPGERPGFLPLALPDARARYEVEPPAVGGSLGFFASTRVLRRNNAGVDSERFGFGVDWERETVLPVGLAIKGFGQVRADVFRVDDPTGPEDDTIFRLAPLAGVQARFPLIAETDFGEGPEPMALTHVLEPVAQVVLAPFGVNDEDIPVEDSLITEFDETNLFDPNRFSGSDLVEEGPRVDVGLRYALISGGPVGFEASLGQSLRFEDAEEFTTGSGLREAQSDVVASWSARYDPYVTVRQRLRVDTEGGDVQRNALSVGLNVAPVRLATDYVFLAADPAGGIAEDREEVFARANVSLTDEWSVNGLVRHDIERDALVSVGGGLRFSNECCTVAAFVRRNFTATENAPASTSFGIEVQLLTLGGGGGGVTTGGAQ